MPKPQKPQGPKVSEKATRRAAEEFLASLTSTIRCGFNPLDPEIRRQVILIPADEFRDFQVNPVPAILAKELLELPVDWQSDNRLNESAESICFAAEKLFDLPDHLYATINQVNELWICRK